MFYFKDGPLNTEYLITGYAYLNDEDEFPQIKAIDGGFGKKHISLIVTSPLGKPMSGKLYFYAEKQSKIF